MGGPDALDVTGASYMFHLSKSYYFISATNFGVIDRFIRVH
jgi:hypothetical protein